MLPEFSQFVFQALLALFSGLAQGSTGKRYFATKTSTGTTQPGTNNARLRHDSILELFSRDHQHAARHFVEQVLRCTADEFAQSSTAHSAHDDDIDVICISITGQDFGRIAHDQVALRGRYAVALSQCVEGLALGVVHGLGHG